MARSCPGSAAGWAGVSERKWHVVEMAKGNSVEVILDEITMARLELCARWREVSVPDLARAYIEDWIDVDAEEATGRPFLRNSIYRDYKISIEERLEARRDSNGA
jgi:hypothetical protein